jgi:hypothetical protein
MQDLVLFYVPLAPVASLARYLISLAAWFKLAPVLEVKVAAKSLYRRALAAPRALPFNTSLNPTADKTAFIRETLL